MAHIRDRLLGLLVIGAVRLPIKVPQIERTVVARIGIVALALVVVSARRTLQAVQLSDPTVRPVVRIFAVPLELDFPHRLPVLGVVLVRNHSDEDVGIVRIEIVKAAVDDRPAIIHRFFVVVVRRVRAPIDRSPGREKANPGQNALRRRTRYPGRRIVQSLGQIIQARIHFADHPLEYVVLRCLGDMQFLGARVLKIQQGYVAPALRKQKVVIGAHETTFVIVEPVGIQIRIPHGVHKSIGVLDPFIDGGPEVINLDRPGTVLQKINLVSRRRRPAVRQIVVQRANDRIIASVEILVVHHPVDSGQPVEDLLFCIVIRILHDDGRLDIEQAARSRRQRRCGQHRYFSDSFHGLSD